MTKNANDKGHLLPAILQGGGVRRDSSRSSALLIASSWVRKNQIGSAGKAHMTHEHHVMHSAQSYEHA